MTFRALELRTQAILMDGISSYDDRGDLVIQSTPSEPDYWEGNRVILRDASVDAVRAQDIFVAAFPQAKHLCFAFDVPGLAATDIDPGYAALGCKVETGDTLTLTGPLQKTPLPAGITLRPLSSEADWAQSRALALIWGRDDGYDPDSFAAFHARRSARNRALIAQGAGQWFGAFDGEQLVGQMGMFHDARLARYQDVQTIAAYRGRGIASALLAHCALWVHSRAPDALPVIVADAGSDAGRLYRAMGFALAETLIFATRPAY